MLTKFRPPPSSSPSLKLETFCSPVLSWNCQFSDPPLVGTITTLTCFFMDGFPQCWWKVWHWLDLRSTGGQDLDQAALCAPPVVSLQSVAGYCYYQLSLFFWPRWLACAMRACVHHAPWTLLSPSFSLSSSLFFSPSFAFDPLRGISRVRNFFFFGYFFFFTKKEKIFERFFNFLRPAFSRGNLLYQILASRQLWTVFVEG